MKNIFRLMSVAALAGAMLFTACKKDEEEIIDSTPKASADGKIIVEFTPENNNNDYYASTDTLNYSFWLSYDVTDTCTWYYFNAFNNRNGDNVTCPWLFANFKYENSNLSVVSLFLGQKFPYMRTVADTLVRGLYPFNEDPMCFPEWTVTEWGNFAVENFTDSCYSFDLNVTMGNIYEYYVLHFNAESIQKANVHIHATNLKFTKE